MLCFYDPSSPKFYPYCTPLSRHDALPIFRDLVQVGLPDRCGVAEAADRLAVLLDVGDDQHLRIAGHVQGPVLVGRRDIEHAEALAEGDELGVGDPLIAAHQHQMVEPGPVDRGEGSVVDLAAFDAAAFDAERVGNRHGLYRVDGYGDWGTCNVG